MDRFSTNSGAPTPSFLTALPVSEDLAERIMALPIHPDLTEADLARICDAVLANV